MRELKGDLWKLAAELKPDAVVISTNGFVKASGHAVMGRGCALEAAKRWPDLPLLLGHLLMNDTLRVQRLTNTSRYLASSTGVQLPYQLIAFPVKPREFRVAFDKSNVVAHMRKDFQRGQIAPGWASIADPMLIQQSAFQLRTMIEQHSWTVALCPRFGAGAGGLQWDEVQLLIQDILDDRVIVVSK
jgi:hypothetical protein